MSTVSSIGNASWPDPLSSRAKPRGDRAYADGAAALPSNDNMSSPFGHPAAGVAALAPATPSEAPTAQSLAPAAASTVAFAQRRGSADEAPASDGVSLSDLLDQIASDLGSPEDGSTTEIDLSSDDPAVADAVFDSIDTNGDGNISQAEFEAAFAGDGSDDDSIDATGGAGSDTLDALGDSGSAAGTEQASGQFADLVSSLASALDNSNTGTLSAAQADDFKNQFDSAIGAMASNPPADGGAASAQPGLADMVLKQYSQAMLIQPQPASFSASA